MKFSLASVALALALATTSSMAAQQKAVMPVVTNPQDADRATSANFLPALNLARRLEEAYRTAKSNGAGQALVPLLSQPQVKVSLEYDVQPATKARTEEGSAQMYQVIEGAGTMTVGGKLTQPVRSESAMTSLRAEGGSEYELYPGDLLFVPPNCEHAITAVKGKLAMLTVLVPIGKPDYWPQGNGRFADLGDPNIYISAHDIADRMVRADAMIRSGVPDRGPFSLLSQPPYRVTMDDRLVPNGHVDKHPFTAELFLVLDGSGAVAVGGTMTAERGRGNDIMAASTDGAVVYPVQKGDIILVPAGAGHAVSRVSGKLTMLQLHIPTSAQSN